MNNRTTRKAIDTLIALSLCAVTAIIILSPKVPLLRTLNEFSVHIMLIMLVLGMIFMFLNKNRVMFAALACAAALSIWLKNASNDNLKLPIVNEEVKLIVAHVNLSNVDDRFDELLGIMTLGKVDVLSFQELTPDWSPYLAEKLNTDYPYHYTNVRIDPYGMGVYSKLPLLHKDTILCGSIPSLCIEMLKNGEKFHLVSSYLTPALDKNSLHKASAQLQRISREVNRMDNHVLALGEYNMTYWTQEIRQFRSDTKLHNSRRDITQGNLRVPYDHIFFSPDLECTAFKEVHGEGNKYLGIMGIYQIKSGKKSTIKDWSTE